MAERVEDLNLPNSVVTRIIKDCLPDGVNVAKEARTAVGRAASVFVLYLTSAANNAAVHGNRKTITAKDVFHALADTNFEFFEEPLKESLEGFKKTQQDKKLAAAKKKENMEETKKDEKAAEESEERAEESEEKTEEVMEVPDEEEITEEVDEAPE